MVVNRVPFHALRLRGVAPFPRQHRLGPVPRKTTRTQQVVGWEDVAEHVEHLCLVTNLNPCPVSGTTEASLTAAFAGCEVKGCRLQRLQPGNRSRGEAYVWCHSRRGLEAALQMDGCDVDGSRMAVKVCVHACVHVCEVFFRKAPRHPCSSFTAPST